MADERRAATTAAYDQIVDDFARRNATVTADFAGFRAAFVAAVRPGGRVADLGCGPGRDAAHFAGCGLDIVAVDASREMVRRARRAGVRAVHADIRCVPLRPGSLDAVWSAASLLHVPRPEVPATLRAWWEGLVPAGVLALSTSLGDDEGWEVCPYDPATQSTSVPLRRWFVHHRAEELSAFVDAAGFDAVHVSEHVSHRHWIRIIATRRDERRARR